jgi:hypothetical protein
MLNGGVKRNILFSEHEKNSGILLILNKEPHRKQASNS